MQSSGPKLFKQVTNALGMVSLPEEDRGSTAGGSGSWPKKLSLQEGEEVDALVEGMFRTQMEVNFAFSSYLAAKQRPFGHSGDIKYIQNKHSNTVLGRV